MKLFQGSATSTTNAMVHGFWLKEFQYSAAGEEIFF